MPSVRRVRATPLNTVLCAVKFWSHAYGKDAHTRSDGGGIMTLRSGARMVARKQGLSTAEVVRAEKALLKAGLLEADATGIRVTAKGRRISCRRVMLSPWTDAQYPGSALSGRRR